MASNAIDLVNPQTGEVLFRAERVTRGSRTPQWAVVFIRMSQLQKLNMQETAVLSYLLTQMGWGNIAPVGAFDVARRFGIKKRTAQKHLAGLVKAGVVERLNANCHRVSTEIAWRGRISEWHKMKAMQAQA